jgi:hypothetical protein
MEGDETRMDCCCLMRSIVASRKYCGQFVHIVFQYGIRLQSSFVPQACKAGYSGPLAPSCWLPTAADRYRHFMRTDTRKSRTGRRIWQDIRGVYVLCLPVYQRGLSYGTTRGLRGALENIRVVDGATGGSSVYFFDEYM